LLLLKYIVNQTGDPIPGDDRSTSQTTGTEPSLPSFITQYPYSTKSKEPEVPEISYTSLKTPGPEPSIPTLSQEIYEPSTRIEPTIPKVTIPFDRFTTEVSEPDLPEENHDFRHSTKHATEPKLPEIDTTHIFTAKSEPKIIDVTQDLKTFRTE